MIIAEGSTQSPHVEELRASIAHADREIVAMIAHRLDLVRALGEEKARQGLPAADPAREAAVLRNVSEAARASGMPEEPVRDVFWCVIDMCRTAQLREQHA